MNEQEHNLPLVTLFDLWKILKKRFTLLLLAAAVAVSGLFVVNRLLTPPRYASTAVMYILRHNDDTISTSEDFSLALKVVSDCSYLLRSHSVLDVVIQDLELELSYDELYHSISTANPEDTRILEVTVEAASPELAKRIVDAVCTEGTQRIKDAIGFQQVNLYEYGTWESQPCNRAGLTDYVLAAIAGAGLTFGFYVVAFLLETQKKES